MGDALRRALGLALIALPLAACVPAPSQPPQTSDAPSASLAGDSPSLALVGSGQPYTASDVLAKMSEPSAKIPQQLRSLDVAAALSRAIWSYDGKPYQAWNIEASCPTIKCELSVGGAPAFLALGTKEDSYAFVVPLTNRQVMPAASDGRQELAGYPAELDSVLDGLGRSLVAPADLVGTTYSGATWWLPPRFGEFTLHYASGEEESKTVWITLSLPDRRLISVDRGASPAP
jgi:hypothetical protein